MNRGVWSVGFFDALGSGFSGALVPGFSRGRGGGGLWVVVSGGAGGGEMGRRFSRRGRVHLFVSGMALRRLALLCE